MARKTKTKMELQIENERLRSILDNVIREMRIVAQRTEGEGPNWTFGFLQQAADSAEKAVGK